jgi:hypothetical protein
VLELESLLKKRRWDPLIDTGFEVIRRESSKIYKPGGLNVEEDNSLQYSDLDEELLDEELLDDQSSRKIEININKNKNGVN